MKITLITGASSGMGLEYARQLAAKGNDLLIVSNQQEQLIEATSMLVEEYGVNVIPRYQDLAKEDAAQQLYDYCKEQDYEVDTLVCNAGIFFFKEMHPKIEPLISTMLNLHVITNTKLCMLFGEDMKKRRSGHILIVSSLAAVLPMPGITMYASTKAYLKSFGRSLYFEMRPYGVGVTTVCPAAVATTLYNLKPSLMDFAVKIGVIWTPQRLVRLALRAMYRKRRLYSPGFMNVWMPAVISILPKPLVNAIWNKLDKD